MVLETPMKLYRTEPDFFGKTFFAPKIGEMGQKWGFLNLKKNVDLDSLNLLYNENLYYL